MDHSFSTHEYFISCSITLLYVGLLSASYFDISTCPYSYTQNGAAAVPVSLDGSGVGGGTQCTTAGGSITCQAPSHAAMKSLLSALAQNNGLSCHMIDIAIWIYIVGLVVFMGHKYYTYRMQGLHYFFLDYCYFHNATLLVFLLWRLVDVRWSDEPIVSWAAYVPAAWKSRTAALSLAKNSSTALGTTGGGGGGSGAFQHPILTSEVVNSGHNLAKQAVVTAAKDSAAGFPDGLYRVVSVDILTTGYVTSNMSADEVLSSFVVFFTLLTGSFGPILGAIVTWTNALLFQSFDRMSSCYLHLLPAIIQAMLLHRLFTAARREVMSASPAELFRKATELAARFREPLENFLPPAAVSALAKMPDVYKGQPQSQQDKFARFAAKHPYEAFCGEGTMCHELGRSVTFLGLLKLHLYMFLVWELVYNVFGELRRRQREHKARKELMRLTGSTEEEAELLRPAVSLSEGLAGDPAKRVTAYTWMMDHPPGGKKGVPYRFVTCLGMGRLPTTILFQVTQLLLHIVFFSWSYPVLYIAFHVAFSAWPLLLYVVGFLLITVYHAACMNQKWISKLQRMAAMGMESERQRQSFVAPPQEQPSSSQAPTGAATAAAGDEKKLN